MVQGWEQRATLKVGEVASLLGIDRWQVDDLIRDHAFGDPRRLARTGRGPTAARLVPVRRLVAFVERGERGYPPGDDPTADATAGTAGTAGDDEVLGASA